MLWSLPRETSSGQWVSTNETSGTGSDVVSDPAAGGAFGLAIANALFNNNVRSNLLYTFNPEETARVTETAITYLGSTDQEARAIIVNAYAQGLRSCYILFAVGSGTCFLLSLFIKEVKFRKDPPGLGWEGKKPRSENSQQGSDQTSSEEKV